ncbi:SgcJ/EcaC family oxidoreductase [Longispora sp. K20-0274]|uniref:SgcJ/EcaC family oxidoreductase n=1 Tax=Longispora sp. K20-0274 TaxID=3088255 RepID=UPI0039997ED0
MDRTADTAAIHTLLAQLTDAWNRADGAAYGSAFTADATYITILGTLYTGPDDIANSHQVLLDTWLKGTKLVWELVDLRFPGPDTAVVVTRGDTFKGRPGKLTKIQTYTVVREPDGRWRIAAFHNTQRKPIMEAVSFRFQPDSMPAAQH